MATELDLNALAGMTERQQLRYLMKLTSVVASTECADLHRAKTAPRKKGVLTELSASQTQATAKRTAEPICRATPPTRKAVPRCQKSVSTGPTLQTRRCASGDRANPALELFFGNETSPERVQRLKGFKSLADQLLPMLRRDSHLHNLIFSAPSHTLLCRPEVPDGEEVGGATFRLLQLGDMLAMVVSVIVVRQADGISRRGLGTCLVDTLKLLLAKEATQYHCKGIMLTHADDGETASGFWKKQGLCSTAKGTQILHDMHAVEPRLVGMYDGSTPMAWETPTTLSDAADSRAAIENVNGEHHSADAIAMSTALDSLALN